LVIVTAVVVVLVVLAGVGFYLYDKQRNEYLKKINGDIITSPVINPASATEPITVSDISIQSKSTKSEKVPIGFYCNSSKTCENAKPQIIRCLQSDNSIIDLNENGISFSVPETNVKPHDSLGFMGVIKISDNTQPGNYLCKMDVDDSNNPGQKWAVSKQVILTIK